MIKQIKRLKYENAKENLVAIDSVIVNKGVHGYFASIKGSDLSAQLDFGDEVVIDTTTEDGKDQYYILRPTQESGLAIPTKEGFYSLEGAEVWIDNRAEAKDKHILRVKKGTFVLCYEFKR